MSNTGNITQAPLYVLFHSALMEGVVNDGHFSKIVQIEKGYPRYKFANDLFTEKIEPELDEKLLPEGSYIFCEFNMALKNNWDSLNIALSLGGSTQPRLEKFADEVAQEAYLRIILQAQNYQMGK